MKKHITHPYIINPTHLLTISVIGIGGTGTQVLSCLARINTGLIALGHPGIHVIAYDSDIVSEANIGRQMFSPTDLGVNKAISSITRINRFFGFDWEAVPENYNEKTSNFVITCTDNISSRIQVSNLFKKDTSFLNKSFDNNSLLYWLDFGNSRNIGQVILGSAFHIGKLALKNVDQLFDLKSNKEEDQGPSCSLAEALTKQDMFINSTLAQLGCNLLWKLISKGQIDHQGLFLNLDTMNVKGIPI
ncbi:thiazole biosynthesis adenylyltransferase ThiF [Sphingobacterium mizutaii NBRC 14946 = DSM 11724]|uniref:PRTRC system ThiF family protein n=2 Tax=Sphingobacterium mizutaii TaxID=1010 RepID=A0AAJ4XCW8_9SPHI|nr:PRTRC system ThiF family protein [Sphingobacterium mizutaii]GEM67582.1 thiazole biosynthesis adenylyltransferase ThiF [Sphingobacterium mizutaii NBRC 14946 = DSM 11724]SDL14652.1 PRTRC system ThiF family protein [Sphingobacterium mizutaii]SNV52191.1 PRTRC system ThiF family protein [Sphingobacterium mizutaii]